MAGYFAIVEQEGDSAFGVRFPDVAGCYSAADDAAEVLKSACEALSLHLEGFDLPPARSVAEIRQDSDVKAALAKGAYLLYVPLVSVTERQVRANISLSAGDLRFIDEAADLRGLTRSAFIVEAARNEIVGRS